MGHSFIPQLQHLRLAAFINMCLSRSNVGFFLSISVSYRLLLKLLVSPTHLFLIILLTLVMKSLLPPSFSEPDPNLMFVLQFFLSAPSRDSGLTLSSTHCHSHQKGQRIKTWVCYLYSDLEEYRQSQKSCPAWLWSGRHLRSETAVLFYLKKLKGIRRYQQFMCLWHEIKWTNQYPRIF